MGLAVATSVAAEFFRDQFCPCFSGTCDFLGKTSSRKPQPSSGTACALWGGWQLARLTVSASVPIPSDLFLRNKELYMSTLVGMSLDNVLADFPDLAPGLQCMRPVIDSFDDRLVYVEREKRYLRVDSDLPLPWIDKAIARWTATVYPEKVHIGGFKRWHHGTFRSVWSDRPTFEDFALFLQKVNDHQKKAGKPRKRRQPAS